jgi:hypothetical protein
MSQSVDPTNAAAHAKDGQRRHRSRSRDEPTDEEVQEERVKKQDCLMKLQKARICDNAQLSRTFTMADALYELQFEVERLEADKRDADLQVMADSLVHMTHSFRTLVVQAPEAQSFDEFCDLENAKRRADEHLRASLMPVLRTLAFKFLGRAATDEAANQAAMDDE